MSNVVQFLAKQRNEIRTVDPMVAEADVGQHALLQELEQRRECLAIEVVRLEALSAALRVAIEGQAPRSSAQ